MLRFQGLGRGYEVIFISSGYVMQSRFGASG
jgi:hypothetical protein